MSLSPPPALALDALLSGETDIFRRVDIFEEDGETPFLLDAGYTDGSVTVDASREERRMLDLTLGNPDGAIRHSEQGLWYDKVVKAYRGCHYFDPAWNRVRTWEVQLGEFGIDDIQSQNFPHTIAVKCIDQTAKLIGDKLTASTTFVKNQPIEAIIKTIALNGGISKFLLPVTGQVAGKDFTFEKGTTRWKAITDVAGAYGYEVFFDANGYLVLREYLDPSLSPTSFVFDTDPQRGTIATWGKSTNQSRLYNQIIVYGDTDGATLPVYAVATNNDPSSPTSVQRLRRTKSYEYTSSFITTQEQALDTANKFLKVHSLEEYNLSLSTIVLPWLEANEIIGFEPTDREPLDPTRFLLSNFTVPLGLGAMTPVGKRVQIIG